MRIRSGQTRLVLVGLVVLALGALPLAQGNSSLGTWKLNVAKSKYGAAPAPKSTTITIVAAGTGATTTSDAVAADGTTQRWSYTGGYDGKDMPMTGNNPFGDTASRKRIDANTTETTFKRAGKVTLVNTVVVSADGKTLTVTGKGTDDQGRPVTLLQIFEKQ